LPVAGRNTVLVSSHVLHEVQALTPQMFSELGDQLRSGQSPENFAKIPASARINEHPCAS
jgi:hypothetical protein